MNEIEQRLTKLILDSQNNLITKSTYKGDILCVIHTKGIKENLSLLKFWNKLGCNVVGFKEASNSIDMVDITRTFNDELEISYHLWSCIQSNGYRLKLSRSYGEFKEILKKDEALYGYLLETENEVQKFMEQ